MSEHLETNPHFGRPVRPLGSDQDHSQHLPDQPPRKPSPWSSRRPHQEGPSHQPGQRRSRKQRPDKQSQPPRVDPQPARAPLAPHRDLPDDQYYQPHRPLVPYPHHHDDPQHLQQPSSTVPSPRRDQGHPYPDPHKQHGSSEPSTHHQGQLHRPQEAPLSQHLGDQHHRREQHNNHVPRMPRPRKTKAFTWCTAVFCAIFWIIIILGGLVVLIVYLVFRPRSPRFDVSTATLNAAYLDMGYLLNADLTILANFTNPNKKVSVDFSYMYVELHYGRTLVATQAIEPFSAPKAGSMFAGLHMVTSQVRLSELEIQRIKRQTLNNGVIFEVKGFFRARSNFGGLLKYSYWLHGECTIMVRRPPDGVLVAKKCKTKH